MTDLDGYASQKIESLRAQAGLLLPRNGRCFEHSSLLAKETLHVSGSQVAVRATGKKTGELLFHVGSRAERVAQKEKGFLLRIQVLALESEQTIRWKDTASFPLLLLI